MVEGLRVPVAPRAKPSGFSTPIGPSMTVRSRRSDQLPKTPSAEKINIYTISTDKAAEVGSVCPKLTLRDQAFDSPMQTGSSDVPCLNAL